MPPDVRSRGCVLAALLVIASAPAHALLSIAEPWVRPAAAGQSTAAYMELTSTEGATLLSARSPVARNVTIAGGTGGARPIAGLPLPPGSVVVLAPRGERLRLDKLARAVRLGQRVPLTLRIRNADGTTQDVEVDAEVRRRSPSEDHGVHRARAAREPRTAR